MLRATVVTFALLLGVAPAAGCSGDELPDRLPAEQVRDGLGALFAGDHAGDLEREAGRCFAEELTERVSLERLREAGVLDERHRVVADLPPLPEDLAEDWADAQLACVDPVEQSTQAQVRLSKGRIDAEAYAVCVREALTEEDMRAAVVASLSGRWEAAEVAALADAQGACRRQAMPADG